jgi:hypothetical protein
MDNHQFVVVEGACMRRWLRWYVRGGLFATTVAAGLFAWWVRPIPATHVREERPGGIVVREHRRSHALLPVKEWGFGRSSLVACGPKGSYCEDHQRFGVFKMVDTREDFIWRAGDPEPPPQ